MAKAGIGLITIGMLILLAIFIWTVSPSHGPQSTTPIPHPSQGR